MDDSLNEPEYIVRLAEELITVIDNEKIENTLLDNIVKEWQKILEIREIQKAQTKQVFQGNHLFFGGLKPVKSSF